LSAAASALLKLDGISRAFGGVRAAASVSFEIAPGSVHGLIGPNGAGKTTVLNLISGVLRPDSGSILFSGQHIERLPAYRIAELGIRRTYQNIRLFGAMSARDNVIVGLHNRRSDSFWQRLCFTPGWRRADRDLMTTSQQLLERAGIGARARTRARDLAYGEQRRLEIARALAASPSLLLLDEPAAGMSASEVDDLAVLIQSIAQQGTAILLVEHNVELVMRVSNVLTVLDFGEVLASGAPDAVRHDPRVIAAYLGAGD
jgi:ABC-type branched-subunit amino acid transport system ATPase component